MTSQELRKSQISNIQWHLDTNIEKETIVASYTAQALIRSLLNMVEDGELSRTFNEKIKMVRPEDM